MNSRYRAVLGVFLITFLSYSAYWQSRDWNSASRLMLTYALGDRGTVSLTGLDQQTGDKAFYRGQYYTDKLPGYSVLALPPYLAAKGIFRLPPHPLNQPGFALWVADYWVTLATSGLATALASALLAYLAMTVGCHPRLSVLVGLAYGLGTPAYAYATMAYGHQASAFALLGAFALIWKIKSRSGIFLAGVLAAYASVIELQVGPVSAILGTWCLAQAILKTRPWSDVFLFSLGAAGPTLFLGLYNLFAFGSPLEMGYFHHATQRFAQVHSKDNPLGLRRPDLSIVGELLCGEKRGLLIFAPIVALVPFGFYVMFQRGEKSLAIVTGLIMLSIFGVNLSYPEWTGGWSTGPRLLVPLLPFAVLTVAQSLAVAPRWVIVVAIVLSIFGWMEMSLFVGIGGRIPDPIARPLRDAVWPLWTGAPLPGWATGGRFARLVVDLSSNPKPNNGGAWRFVPLALFQIVAGLSLVLATPSRSTK